MIVNAMDYIVNPLITNFEHLSRHDSDSLGQIKNLSMKTRSDCFIITAFHIMGLEKPPTKKPGKFGTIDSNVGGWGRVVPNFYKSMFLWHI